MRALLALVLCATAVAAQRRMPGGYVVELASASSAKRAVEVHAEFLDALDKRSSGNFRTRQKYSSKHFNGIAVQLTSPKDLVDIASLPNVVAVRPLYIQPGPEPVAQRTATDSDSVLGQSVHIMTGVDAVHAAGYKGKDIRIAILDSGVDYTHPALGGGFGPGFKISGTDLVGDAYNGDNTPVPDDDPMDCLGHGTHVTGIIGANPDNEYNVVGVAPEANIVMYKIGGCKGGIGDDIIIAAMLRAAAEGADVVSMSFGYYEGWTNSFIAEVASRIADQGVVVTASAGNDGKLGMFLVSSPAIGENVIAVGSVENTAFIKETFTSSVPHGPFKYTNLETYGMPGQPLTGVPETPLPVLALQPFPAGTPPSQCWDLPPDVPADLSGLAIVLHGADSFECPLVELIIDRNPAVVMSYSDPYQIYGLERLILISDEDGFWLAEQAQKGNITVTFPGPLVGDPTVNGGLMNDFSTMGPGNRLEFKPSVSAPGGDIMSTYANGQWTILSGTSMSNPYVAGSAALLLEAKGKGAAKSVRSLLQTTAQIVPSSRADGALPQTLAWQGAGLINVKAALNSQTTVSPAVMLLNDTTHWNGAHTITITNSGKDSQTYSLAHIAAATTVTKPADRPDLSPAPVVSSVPSPFPIPLVSAPVGVKFDREAITIPAGQSGIVKVTVTPPANADTQTLPIVSGWITATSGAGEVVKASYLGLAANFGSAQTIDTTAHTNGARDPLPGIIASSELRFQTGPRNYSLAEADFTVPQYNFGVSVPSTHALLDLVSADTEIQSNVPHMNAKRTWSDWLPSSGTHIDAVSEYPSLGPLAVYEYMPRGARFGDKYRIDLTEFANGTQIPLGQYKVLLRALRPFGDPDRAEDYDVHVSVQFGWVS